MPSEAKSEKRPLLLRICVDLRPGLTPRGTIATLADMKRRLAIALLALLVAVTGVGMCARGVQACTAMGASTADCCGKTAKLAASDCCCPAKAERTSNLPSLPGQAGGASPVLAVAPALLPAAFDAVQLHLGSAVESRAFAPPDTPVSRHTSLLL